MITNFKLFEGIKYKYHIDDMVIVTNATQGLNNRMCVISSIIQDVNGLSIKVWNATKDHNDEEFTISEEDIVKKLPKYKEGEYILLKDYNTGKPKPMIIYNHMELGLFEMIDLEGDEIYEVEPGENVEEPYYNIIRKMNKNDLEKYKDVIEMYHVKNAAKKYNIR